MIKNYTREFEYVPNPKRFRFTFAKKQWVVVGNGEVRLRLINERSRTWTDATPRLQVFYEPDGGVTERYTCPVCGIEWGFAYWVAEDAHAGNRPPHKDGCPLQGVYRIPSWREL